MPPLPARRVIPLMLLAACAACEKELPTAPSELVEGIVGLRARELSGPFGSHHPRHRGPEGL